MKAGVFALLLVICYVECKKTYAPLDKHANLDFINMEGGGGGLKPTPRPAGSATPPPKPQQPAPTPKPTNQAPAQPHPTVKPTVIAIIKPAPAVTPPTPKTPNQIKPVPVNPAPVAHPASTPGPSNVKDLVNFYNSQGKGSPIRPYSYSQAVKQG